MGTWTIETTASEDEAITYAYQQSQRPGMGPPVSPPGRAAAPVETVDEYFQRMTKATTVQSMVITHNQAKNAELLVTLDTIPPENRDAAQADLHALVKQHGGTVKLKKATYLWSDAVTLPPPDQTVIGNVAQADWTLVTKVCFDDEDNAGTSQREGLLGLMPNTTVRIEDARDPTFFVTLILTDQPVAQTGYVELPVRYYQNGGPLAAAYPMNCTFS
jgi:hypothetical protein